MTRKVTKVIAKQLAKTLGVNLRQLPITQWQKGIQVEMEHGTKGNPLTDVTHDNLVTTAKIALAHILEIPDYYVRLEAMEEQARKDWKGQKRPKVLFKK